MKSGTEDQEQMVAAHLDVDAAVKALPVLFAALERVAGEESG